jgi:hypothetical protein
MPKETYTRTGQEVATEVTRIFGDDSLIEITNADLLRWINMAQREIASANKTIKSSATRDIVANQTLYIIPSNIPIFQIQALFVNGLPVKPVSFQMAQEMIQSDDPSLKYIGQPKIWYEWDGDIYIHPAPEKDIVDGLVIYYIQQPDDIALLADTLQVPDRFYNQIVDYVLGQAYRLDENWQATQYQDARFRDSMNRIVGQEDIIDQQYYPSKTVLSEDE